MKIAIANIGSSTINTATFEWSVNGIAQTPFNYTNSLLSAERDTITLGTYNFPSDLSNVEVFVSDVNAQGVDNQTSNDTLLRQYCNGISGAYTIGHNNADFASFNEAVEALKSCGISDTVYFTIQAGIYHEEIWIPAISFTEAITSSVATAMCCTPGPS